MNAALLSLLDCSVITSLFNLNKPLLFNTGRVFYTATAEKFTFSQAEEACTKQGAQLANTGQLYLAWQGGMDVCNAGWLGDRSVRYPINIRRPQCGGGLLGVRTVYLYTNQTGYPLPESRYDAFCYTGRPSTQARYTNNHLMGIDSAAKHVITDTCRDIKSKRAN